MTLILSDDYAVSISVSFLCLSAHVTLALQVKLEFFQWSFCFLSKDQMKFLHENKGLSRRRKTWKKGIRVVDYEKSYVDLFWSTSLVQEKKAFSLHYII